MADLIGRTLGQYQILELIGQGGMAEVYRARQPSIDRDVALKVIEPSKDQTNEFLQRFEREAFTVASLNHAHILKVFDYGHEDGYVYLAMEYLRGGNLASLIDNGPLSLADISRAVNQLAPALDYAHQKGIVHRDLKPQNMMMDEARNFFLTDFGIIKLTHTSQQLTREGTVIGTPAYIAPEQWRGIPIDQRADVYAFGIVLYQMLTGQLPFYSEKLHTLMTMHLSEQPPSILNLRADLPPALTAVIDKALAKDRDDRYTWAGELLRGFNAAIVTQGGTFKPPVDASSTVIMKAASTKEPTVYDTVPLPVAKPMQAPVRQPTAASSPPPARPEARSASSQHKTGLLISLGRAQPFNVPLPVLLVGGGGLILIVVLLIALSQRGTPAVVSGSATPDSSATVQVAANETATDSSAAASPVAPTGEATDAALTTATDSATNSAPLIAVVATNTPTITRTPSPTVTLTPSLTATITRTPSITPTAPPTFTPTSIPTNTPIPSPTPEPSATFTPEPNATELAFAAATATRGAVDAAVAALAQNATVIFGPTAGDMAHTTSVGPEVNPAGVSVQDFIVEARFTNPYADTGAENTPAFDYGFFFRDEGGDREYRLVVRSRNTRWALFLREGGQSASLINGSALGLNVAAGGTNTLRLIAKGTTGWFFLNGQLMAQLDLSAKQVSGDVSIFTGLIDGDKVTGSVTRYDGFTVSRVQ